MLGPSIHYASRSLGVVAKDKTSAVEVPMVESFAAGGAEQIYHRTVIRAAASREFNREKNLVSLRVDAQIASARMCCRGLV